MGIRIHKCLGYGLTDVQGDDDPRFSKNLYDLLEEIYETPIEEVFSRVDRLERGIQACVGTTFKYRKSFIREGQEYASFMTYDSEFGEENVVVFTPILFPSWQRYDDIIDYMDASGGEGAVNKVRVFDHNIYPFSNEMDKRKGRLSGLTSHTRPKVIMPPTLRSLSNCMFGMAHDMRLGERRQKTPYQKCLWI